MIVILLSAVVSGLVTGGLAFFGAQKLAAKKYMLACTALENTFLEQKKTTEQGFNQRLEKINKAVQVMSNELGKSRERMHIALIEKKGLEEKYRDLSIRFMQFGDPDAKETPSVSYKTSDIEISKRIQDAIHPWQIRVEELESQNDLLTLEKNDRALLKEKELENKITLLQALVTEKEQENVDLTLKINKAIMAYEALNKRYKALL